MSHFQTSKPTQFARHNAPACLIQRKEGDAYEDFLILPEGKRRYTLPKGIYYADTYHGAPSNFRAAPVIPPHVWIECESENYAAMEVDPDTGFIQIWYNPATWAGLTYAQRRLIFWHECAHAHAARRTRPGMDIGKIRKIEIACDQQAAFNMIREGFNPCQIAEAAEVLGRFDHGRLRQVKALLKNFEL